MVLQDTIDLNEYHQAVIVTGDGDFYCLVDYLVKKYKLLKLMVPNRNKFSLLFRKMMPHIMFMNDLRGKLEHGKVGA